MNFVYLVEVLECETEMAFSWFCPICKVFANEPRIWINEDRISKYSLQDFGSDQCLHFAETQITCTDTGTQEEQNPNHCSSTLTFQEMQALFPDIQAKMEEQVYFEGIDPATLRFTKTGLIAVSQWIPGPAIENSVYRKMWFVGDCRKCGAHHNSWAYL